MSKAIAVAVVHGVGDQREEEMANAMKHFIKRSLAVCPDGQFVFKSVYWAPALADQQKVLWNNIAAESQLGFFLAPKIRRITINYAADALAYQPISMDRRAYDNIHAIFAQTLHELAQEAGPEAPLVIIAHSLGSVISSNYIYDLQVDSAAKRIIPQAVRQYIGDTPLERGETISHLFTLGSPLALWSLRYDDFGSPIRIPAPELGWYHPAARGKWINFYDKDDVLGYPLKPINHAYHVAVVEDRQVNVGRLYEYWNPASHMAYWRDRDVVNPICDELAELWRAINP